VTIVGISYMQVEAMRAQRYLQEVGVSAEVIDPIWLSPLDIDTIAASAAKTGRLLVVDNGWSTCGASAEILSAVYEKLQGGPHQIPLPRARRMAFAPTPCPTTPSLEQLFYPNARTIAAAANDLVKGGPQGWLPQERAEFNDVEFKGPF